MVNEEPQDRDAPSGDTDPYVGLGELRRELAALAESGKSLPEILAEDADLELRFREVLGLKGGIDLPSAVFGALAADVAPSDAAEITDYFRLFPDEDGEDPETSFWEEGDTVIEDASSRTSGRQKGRDLGFIPRTIGNYRVLDEIGRGGQGVVFRAEDLKLGRIVAVKVLNTWSMDSDRILRRFHREGLIASRLDDPGICTVYETGVHEGMPFIAMRYVEGHSLAEMIVQVEDSDSREEVERRIEIIEGVARSLHVAHEAGVVHRDVKPGNIILDGKGRPVLLDFGLAGEEDGLLSTLTRTGEMQGTAPYLAPEQIDAKGPLRDRRIDVYALGVTLFELLARRRPFESASRAGLLDQIRRVDPPSLRSFVSRIPADLDIVIDTVLEKDPQRRYRDALAFANDLRNVREGKPVAARRISRLGRLLRWARRRPAVAALCVLLLFGLPALAAMGGFIAANLDGIEKQKDLEEKLLVERRLARAFGELGEGDPVRADEIFDQVLAEHGESAAAIGGKATSLGYLGKSTEALGLVRSFLKKEESAGLRRLSFVIAELEEGIPRPAPEDLPTLESAEDFFLNAEILLTRYHDDHEDETARAAQRSAHRAVLLAREPQPRHYFTLSHAAGHTKDVELAAHMAETITTIWPDWAEAWYWAAYSHHGFDDEKAINYGRKCLEIEPRHLRAADVVVYGLLKSGRFQEAEVLLRASLTLMPDEPKLLGRMAHALERLGRPEEALDYVDRSLKIAPDLRVSSRKVFLLEKLKRNDEAERAYEIHLNVFPEDIVTRRAAGVFFARTGRLDQALHHFELVAENTGAASDYHNSARALRGLKRLEEAEKTWRQALAIQPDHESSLHTLGFLLLNQGRGEEAIDLFERLTVAHPGNYNNHAALAIGLSRLGHYEEASRAYFKSRETAPSEKTWVWTNHANTLKRLGREEDELDAIRELRQRRPDDVAMMIDLGNRLLEYERVEEAQSVAQSAVKAAPGSARVHFLQGRIREAEDDPAGALECYERALRAKPNYAQAWCNKGYVLRGLERWQESYDAYRRGHEAGLKMGQKWRYPSGEWLKEAKRLLEASREG